MNSRSKAFRIIGAVMLLHMHGSNVFDQKAACRYVPIKPHLDGMRLTKLKFIKKEN